MAKWKIEISKSAEKQLKKIDKSSQRKIAETILNLESNPYPTGFLKLAGHQNTFRIRIGDYRVIYAIKNKELTILILKVGHRKDIYR